MRHTLLRRWLARLLRALVESSGSFVGGLSVALAVSFPFARTQDFGAAGWASWVILSAVAAYLVAGWLVLRYLTPDAYARVVISGRPTTEIFSETSRLISELLVEFTRESNKWVLRFSDLDLPSENGADAALVNTAKNKGRFAVPERGVRRLQAVLEDQHVRLQRLEEIQRLSAKEMGIPLRRLADHVLGWSPDIHRARTDKFLQNVRELARVQDVHLDPSMARRVTAVVRQNRRIHVAARWRLQVQKELNRHRDLHDHIRSLASSKSTSASLYQYSLAVRDAVVNQRGAGHAFRRASFLRAKAKAHPGYDIHALLISLLASCTREEKTAAEGVRAFLQAEDAGALSVGAWEQKFDSLPTVVVSAMNRARDGVVSNFQHLIATITNEGDSLPVFVTNGYSRTVREALTRPLVDPPKRAEDKSWPKGILDEARVFLLTQDAGSPAEREGGSFDLRLMGYELKDHLRALRDRLPPPADGPNPVRSQKLSALNPTLLGATLRPRDIVIVVIGAEGFDNERRVLHPRGGPTGLGHLRMRIRAAGASSVVVVVAEEYKRQPVSLIENIESFEDHLDRLELYDKGEVDFIVTEAETFGGLHPDFGPTIG